MDPYIAKVIKLLDKNKAVVAFLAPFVVTLLTAVANWIVTGEFSTNELRIALGGTLLSVVSGIGASVTPATKAVVDAVPAPVDPKGGTTIVPGRVE